MEFYIQYINDFRGYVKKEAQTSNVSLFKSKGSGLGITINPSDIDRSGPALNGSEFVINLKVEDSFNNWTKVFQTMGRVEKALTSMESGNAELNIKFRASLGVWSRIEDESNLIYENRLTLKGVRLGAKVT